MNEHPPYLATLVVQPKPLIFNTNNLPHISNAVTSPRRTAQPLEALLGMAKRQALVAANEPPLRRPSNLIVREEDSDDDCYMPSVRAESPELANSPTDGPGDTNMDLTESSDGSDSRPESDSESEAKFTDGSASYSASYQEDQSIDESLAESLASTNSGETANDTTPKDLYTAFMYVCAIDLLIDGKQVNEAGCYEEVADGPIDQYYRMGEQCLGDPDSILYQSECAQNVLEARMFFATHEQFCAEQFGKGQPLHRLAKLIDGALKWEFVPDSTTVMRFTHYNERKKRFVYRKHAISESESKQLASVWFFVNLRMAIKCELFYIIRTEPGIVEDDRPETIAECVMRIFYEHETLSFKSWVAYNEHMKDIVEYNKQAQ